jgi:hypothetical protein
MGKIYVNIINYKNNVPYVMEIVFVNIVKDYPHVLHVLHQAVVNIVIQFPLLVPNGNPIVSDATV